MTSRDDQPLIIPHVENVWRTSCVERACCSSPDPPRSSTRCFYLISYCFLITYSSTSPPIHTLHAPTATTIFSTEFSRGERERPPKQARASPSSRSALPLLRRVLTMSFSGKTRSADPHLALVDQACSAAESSPGWRHPAYRDGWIGNSTRHFSGRCRMSTGGLHGLLRRTK